MSLFDTVFDRCMGHEGGFQNARTDRANWTSGKVGQGKLKGTKWGISAMSYPEVDIVNLTREAAKEIYKRDWWDGLQMAQFGPGLCFQMFDAAINHGMDNATMMLQKALGTKADGIIGPKTKAALAVDNPSDTCLLFLAARMDFFLTLGMGSWQQFGRGWMKRVADNLRYAAQDL